MDSIICQVWNMIMCLLMSLCLFVCMCKIIYLKFCRISHGVAKNWTRLSDWTDWILHFKKSSHYTDTPLQWPRNLSYSASKLGMCMLSHAQLFVTSWTIGCQAPLSMRFSWQEYWRVLPLPSPIQHLKSILIQLF